MPSPKSEALAAAYYAAQFSAAQKVAAFVSAKWVAQFSAGAAIPDLRAAADAWLGLVLPVVMAQRLTSTQLGLQYYRLQRRLELPNEPSFALPRVEQIDKKHVASSLWFVGPHDFVDNGKSIDEIVDEARISLIEGSALRHVANGGRDAMDESRKKDGLALAYYRQTSSDPCYFCAALASRGAIYKEGAFDETDARFEGDGNVKVHDHCACFNRPIYVPDDTPGETKKYRDLWEGDWKPRPGEDPMNAFRQFYEGRRTA